MDFVEIRGKRYERIPCGEHDFLEYNKDGKACKDCGVEAGKHHKEGCEAEMCPAREKCEIFYELHHCAGQLCGCELQPKYLDEACENNNETQAKAGNSELTNLEQIRLKLDNLMGMIQVCASAFDHSDSFAFMNERDVSGAFYTILDQISHIEEDMNYLIIKNL